MILDEQSMSRLLHHQNYKRLIAEIKTTLTSILEDFSLIIIFGSVSRFEGTILSDVDILVVGPFNARKAIKETLSDFSMNHGIGVDLIFIPEKEFSVWKTHPLVKRALKEGIILWNQQQMIERG